MIVKLAPSWILTDEHSSSSYGQPVLVRTATGEVHGPGDLAAAYDSWPLQPASHAVRRMARINSRLTAEELEFVGRFVS